MNKKALQALTSDGILLLSRSSSKVTKGNFRQVRHGHAVSNSTVSKERRTSNLYLSVPCLRSSARTFVTWNSTSLPYLYVCVQHIRKTQMFLMVLSILVRLRTVKNFFKSS